MISASTCIYQEKQISIHEALQLRNENNGMPRGAFTCIECGQDVRAHNASEGSNHPAHFEHFERNSACSYSESESAVNRTNVEQDVESHYMRDIITAAFNHIAQLELIYGDSVPARELQKGFIFDNEVVHLQSANGIFKPKQFTDIVISITTTISRAGSKNIYKDYEGDDGSYHYAFEKPSTGKHRNQYLINTFEAEMPFVYFKAVAPAVYQCIWPCFIEHVDHDKRSIKIIVGEKPTIIGGATPEVFSKPKEIQARYYVRESKTRGHQAEFREEVLKAYGRKCAISGLPEDKLLQAAHIIPDAEFTGVQTVRNGIALNYLHHKAYDSFLIGIDGEYKVHISEHLKSLSDGPLLEHGILSFDNKKLVLPRNKQARPDQDLLNRKFEKYFLNNKS